MSTTFNDDVTINATLTISSTDAAAIDVAGGINAGSGNVGIVDTTGRIPAISSTYFASLSGADLTNLVASNLASGLVPQAQKSSEGTTTSTGNQDNVDFSGVDSLRCNNASLLTLRGLLAGVPGQRLTIVSVGAGQVDIANEDANSTAANRVINGVTGTISLAPGSGRLDLQYDGTTQRWRAINHEQGAWITPAFSAANFTANGSMTWTVDAGDVTTYAYRLSGRTLSVAFSIVSTSVGGTLNTQLRLAIPGGFTAAKTVTSWQFAFDNGVRNASRCEVTASTTVIYFRVDTAGTSNWSASTNNTAVTGEIIIEVQ